MALCVLFVLVETGPSVATPTAPPNPKFPVATAFEAWLTDAVARMDYDEEEDDAETGDMG